MDRDILYILRIFIEHWYLILHILLHILYMIYIYILLLLFLLLLLFWWNNLILTSNIDKVLTYNHNALMSLRRRSHVKASMMLMLADHLFIHNYIR